jgi:hypothetical protein
MAENAHYRNKVQYKGGPEACEIVDDNSSYQKNNADVQTIADIDIKEFHAYIFNFNFLSHQDAHDPFMVCMR